MSRRASLFLVVVILLALSGCGKRGGLVPAWTTTETTPPTAVSDLAAEVRSGQVWLTWTEPTANVDGTTPARLDRYLIYYEVLDLPASFCLDCPLDLARRIEVDPSQPKAAVFASGRTAVPVETFDPGRKYVFLVLALDPDDRSAGDSNTATLNWPLVPEEAEE